MLACSSTARSRTSAAIPVGGNHISNDIAVGLRTPFMAADEIKIRHGYALSEAIEEDRTIDIASYDVGDGEPVLAAGTGRDH